MAGKLLRQAMITGLSLTCAGIPHSVAFAQEVGRPLFGFAIRSSVLENRFSRQRNEQESISKFLLNSDVTGCQSTVTDTSVRIVPDEQSLRFDFLNSGDVTSQTTGINRDALVDSIGKHHFEITKPFWFDGSVFLTLPGHGTIQASNTPQRVVSAVGMAMPLLSPLTDRVAWDEVIRRQPEINQVVAEDVSRDVLPKIDRLTDGEFARLGREWKVIQQQASAAFGRTSLQWAARSTDSYAAVWTYTDQSGGRPSFRVPIPEAVRQFGTTDEIVVFTSEDAVESLLSQYFPAGLKLTDAQLRKLQVGSEDVAAETEFSMEQLKNRIAGIASPDPAEAGLFTVEFSPENPVEVEFVNGDVRVTTKFQIIPLLGAPSGWMTTSFNLRGKRLPDHCWTVAVRSLDVGTATGASSNIAAGEDAEMPPTIIIPSGDENAQEPGVTTVQTGTAWVQIVRSAATSLAENIPPIKLPLEFDGSVAVPGSPRLRLSRIDSANGMLRVALKIVDGPQGLSLQK